MKKHVHNLLLLPALLFASQAMAQTSIDIYPVTDSSYSYCPLPAAHYLGVQALTNGYNDATDNMTIQVFWGDGADTTYTVDLLDYSGSTDYFYSYVPHNYYTAGMYTPMIVVTGPDGNDDTAWSTPFALSSSCIVVDGYTYEDNNSNCVYDGGDNLVPYSSVVVYNGSSVVGYAYSNGSGYYTMNLPSGFSGLTITAMNSPMTTTCPSSGSYTFSTSSSTSFNFGLECLATTTDYYAHHTGMCGYGAPGSYGAMAITAGVSGCAGATTTATVTLTLDPLVTFTGTMFSGPAPTTVSGGGSVLTWVVPITAGMAWGTGFNVSLETYTSTSAIVLSTTCFDINITGTGTDPDASNNSEHTCLLIGGPYDPNSKEVMPAGIGATGNVAPGTGFDYLINFQNCGTAEAINIYIMDTIDTDLDMATFQITGSSHNMNPIITDGNVVRFDFPFIHLIDSVANEPLSHGWVTYHIEPKSGLTHGTQITNTGHIYFDYNAAVVTNTTLNTIDMTLGTQEVNLPQNKNLLFPNPASTNVTLQFDQPVTGVLYVMDAAGKIVKQVQLNLASLVVIPVSDLESGFYGISIPGMELKQNRIQVIK